MKEDKDINDLWPSQYIVRVEEEILNLRNYKCGQEAFTDDIFKQMYKQNHKVLEQNTSELKKSTSNNLNWHFRIGSFNDSTNKKQYVKDIKSKTVYNHPTIHLPNVNFDLPKMTAWAPVQCNVSFDEETMLHHVPYLGEEVDKHGFVEDLARSYDGLVYGHDLACNEKLYQLVKRLTTTSDSTINNRQLKMNQNGSNNSKPIDMEVVFQLLADMFSAEGFKAEDLAKRYRLYVDQLNLPPDAPQTIMKNLDTEILERPYSFKETMDSYQRLFCRRCYQYDCGPHKNYSYTPFYRAMDDEKLSIYGPCENMCFLLIHGVHIEKYITRKPPTPASSLPFEEALIEKPPTVIVQTIEQADIQHNHWTTTEQTLFNVLMPTMKGNFCKIAGTIGTKTCAEVYVFAQQVDVQLAITSASVLSSDANMINMKKKKETKKNSRKVWLQLIHEKGGNGNESERNKSHYQPCDHIGQQCDTNCICVKNETFCEKFCNCTDCPRKFPGCNCKATCNTKACPCFVANRECDPDLCQSCGSHQLDESKIRCRNVSLQRRHRKHLLLGPSEVAGWGCFLNGTAEKDELISEYCGEMISHDDAERRGKIYDKDKCSYLFDLNSEHVVDAKRKGNKIRFANHSVNPNCYARVRMVNGDSRIGIYAKRKLAKEEELFFDYRYGPNEVLKFVGKERQSIAS